MCNALGDIICCQRTLNPTLFCALNELVEIATNALSIAEMLEPLHAALHDYFPPAFARHGW